MYLYRSPPTYEKNAHVDSVSYEETTDVTREYAKIYTQKDPRTMI